MKKTNFDRIKENITVDMIVDFYCEKCRICPCREECRNDKTERTCEEILQEFFLTEVE